MITLKGSRFCVSYNTESGEHRVFTHDGNGCADVTDSLSDDKKDELVNDLVYALSDLLAKQK